MLRYDDLQVFVHTSDSGSLSAAARQLEISPAVASAALKRLESELEVRLFARSTRSLRLTPEGDAFLLHARASLRSLEEGRRLLTRSPGYCSFPRPPTSAATCCCHGSTSSRRAIRN